ncbi:MAG: hypothetical protein ACR2IK_11935 [Chloroflexota bacterium]
MLGAEAPRRSSSRRVRDAARPLVSLRSPLPLMVGGLGVTLLVIALVTLPPRPVPADPSQTASLGDAEALTLVAHEMRSGAAAARVLDEGQVRFDDGTWYASVGGAHFHFTQRNRIVVADDQPAIELQYRSGVNGQ